MCSSFKGHAEGGKSVQELVPAAAESSLVHRFVCMFENVSKLVHKLSNEERKEENWSMTLLKLDIIYIAMKSFCKI